MGWYHAGICWNIIQQVARQVRAVAAIANELHLQMVLVLFFIFEWVMFVVFVVKLMC